MSDQDGLLYSSYNSGFKTYSQNRGTLNNGATASGTVSGGTAYLQVLGTQNTITSATADYMGVLLASNGGVIDNANLLSGGAAVAAGSGTLSGAVVSSGAGIEVTQNGTVIDPTVLAGGVVAAGDFTAKGQTFPAGGTISGGTFAFDSTEMIRNGSAIGGKFDGTQLVLSGGTATNGVFDAGSTQIVGGYLYSAADSSGGTTIAVGNVQSNSSWAAQSGAIASGATILTGANAYILHGGVASGGTVAGVEHVESGGTTVGVLVSGGTEIVDSGGLTSTTSIESGGTEVVNVGGSAVNTTISGGGLLDIDGGKATSSILTGSNSQLIVESGGSAVYTSALSGGTITDNNGNLVSAWVENGAVVNVENSGYASAINLISGGTGHVSSGGTVMGANISAGSIMDVTSGLVSGAVVSGNQSELQANAGALIEDATVNSYGVINVSNGAVLSGITVSAGGSANLLDGSILSGTMLLADGGFATITTSTGGTVDLLGNTNVGLVISGTGNPTTVISGFSGTAAGNSDGITLAGVKTADIVNVTYPDADHVTFTLADNSEVTLNIIGVEKVGYTLEADSNGDLIYEVCFLAGSMVATPDGERAVETMQVGDLVTAYDWQNNTYVNRSVVWVGRKHKQVKQGVSVDMAGYPVRVCANAIADGVPYKDLLVTPEHCLFFDGKFIPARMLVNGQNIIYDRDISSYDYYHVETEEHSVLTVDGIYTESYLDTGNRRTFRQDGALAVIRNTQRSWENDAAAPLVVTRDVVEPLYNKIVSRCGGLPAKQQELTNDPRLQLETEAGAHIWPISVKGNVYTFMLSSSISRVNIVSRTQRPSDTIGPFVDDRRQLGVLIGNMHLVSVKKISNLNAHLQDTLLTGWNDYEHTGCRWTAGCAELALPEESKGGFRMLSIEVLSAGPYLLADDMENVENQGLKKLA
ncbi:outer membrane protein [Acetobacter pasteurianus NBRC 101655]|nr:outer membrane protein [Acetobacter pasteurianus NBRC 101655]